MKKNNPYTIDFGLKPINYVTRTNEINEIISGFESTYSFNNIYTITGVRGSGKTVTMQSIASYFEQKESWIVTKLISNLNLLDQLAENLYDHNKLKNIFSDLSFSITISGLSLSFKNGDKRNTTIAILKEFLSRVKNNNQKVLICVDEIAKNEFTKPFVQYFQLLLQEGYPVYLLMTGLYQNIYELENDSTLTFLYRSPKINLQPLSLPLISSSFKKIFNMEENKAVEAAKLTKGYAYCYQVLGFLLFEQDKTEINENTINQLDSILSERSYSKIWSELTEKEKDILKLFNNSDTLEASLILKKLKISKQTLSVYRDRLIKKGYLYSPKYGVLSLTLPRFSNFINNIMKFDF